MRIAGAVVLVTGASGGVGAACARSLSARGAHLIVHGRDPDRLAAVAADLGAGAIRADLTELGAAEQLAAAAGGVFGRVDAVVHCAGLGWYGPFSAMPTRVADELLEVNLRAPVRLTRALLGEMIARGNGHVAFLGSIAGWMSVPNEALYAATKAAVLTFAESLHGELAGTGVGISVVSPSAVRTEFFDRRGAPYGRRYPRPVTPERVADVVIRGMECERAHQMVPRWLTLAPVVRATVPPVYRRLRRRLG